VAVIVVVEGGGCECGGGRGDGGANVVAKEVVAVAVNMVAGGGCGGSW
jgi:hypothetical protein